MAKNFTDLAQASRLLNTELPLVTLQAGSGCTWTGKWFFNCSTDSIKALGGPWDTEAEAVAALLATGQYRLRPGTATPHLDRIR